jgi:hypothetical protein
VIIKVFVLVSAVLKTLSCTNYFRTLRSILHIYYQGFCMCITRDMPLNDEGLVTVK